MDEVARMNERDKVARMVELSREMVLLKDKINSFVSRKLPLTPPEKEILRTFNDFAKEYNNIFQSILPYKLNHNGGNKLNRSHKSKSKSKSKNKSKRNLTKNKQT